MSQSLDVNGPLQYFTLTVVYAQPEAMTFNILHIMVRLSLKKCSAWNTPTLGAISAIFVPLSPV